MLRPHMAVTDLSSIFKAYDVRGIYGRDIDGDTAEAIGRGLARALSDLSGKSTADLRVGLGRDMRLAAPELAGRYRDGLVAEGAHVVDAGMVGTEMVYWLVGSRDLDGGLMCTASHNPKAYTGAKMVERGSVALSSDRGLAEVRAHIENGLGPAPGRRLLRGGRHLCRVPARGTEGHRPRRDPPTEGRARRRQRDGGPDGRPDPRNRCRGLTLIPTYWAPDGEFPNHLPNPLLPENREFVVRQRPRERGRPRHRLGRGRRPLLLHRRRRASSFPATSSPRCSPRRSSRRCRAPTSSTTSEPRARCRTRSRSSAAAPS